MISEITIQNLETRKSCKLTQDLSTPFAFNREDVDWGAVNGNHSTYKSPGQVGSFISYTNLKERTVTIHGYIYYIPEKAITSRTEREEITLEKIEEQKELLSQIINPTQVIRIIVEDYYLQGKPDNSVVFGKTEQENNEYFCGFTISVFCNNPMFHRVQNEMVLFSGSTPKFHFPLHIPEEGYIFGERYSYNILPVKNDGDTVVGAIFNVRVLSEVTDLTILNIFTQEKFVIHKTLQAGEEIIINTNPGMERSVEGIVNGVKSNYFQYWDFENTWLTFPQGTSMIGYSVEEGSIGSVSLSVTLNPEKYNLRGI